VVFYLSLILPVYKQTLKNLIVHDVLALLNERNSREVYKMGAIAKAAVIKNRRDKKDDKKD
jgi:hypothetical protein